MTRFDPSLFESGYGIRFHRFQNLMPNRVHDILLVSSVYDSFIIEEDGRLDEGLIQEYLGLNLVHQPRMIRCFSGAEALERIRGGEEFGLVVTTMHLADMHALAFAREVRTTHRTLPLVLLTYDYKELKEVRKRHGTEDFDKVILWQGDYRLLLAVVKYVEDRLNVRSDTELIGVQSIIVIEDSVRFYSTFLPLIYTEVMRHSQAVLAESLNLSHRILRMKARPKVLLCETYEDAWNYFVSYHDNILGVISDIEFPRHGEPDPQAGFAFARAVRAWHPDVPVLLQSSDPANQELAEKIGASFIQKNSPFMLRELRRFVVEQLSFGDFVFRMPDGTEVGRARTLRDLEEELEKVPLECVLHHAQRNHFSCWLKARTEFWLAEQLRPRKVSDYEDPEEVRRDIISNLRDFRLRQQRGLVVDFDPEAFDPERSFARIGGGSLGGKGRGLAFLHRLIETYGINERFPEASISVPPVVVLGTKVFDRFLEDNGLQDFAIAEEDDEEIVRRFTEAPLPEDVTALLRAYLEKVDYPLAVRSSSLLEDSQHQPFAGVYETYMIPNHAPDLEERLRELLTAVRLVYASTFSRVAKTYTRATAYRLEEEKMAVVIQKLVGSAHGRRFYPDFAGVARSHNFYSRPPMRAEDGIANVALGLGTTVVEGGACVRLGPRSRGHVMQFASVEDSLEYSQRRFEGLPCRGEGGEGAPPGPAAFRLDEYDLSAAEEDGVLGLVASTYSAENDAVYDGISRPGVRIVTFAPILKLDVFPLARILEFLLQVGRWSMSASVEIEFAVNYSVPPGRRKEFRVLQMRPMVLDRGWEEVSTREVDPRRIVCESDHVLGNGLLSDIRDIVLVDLDRFHRSRTREVAVSITRLDHRLRGEERPYVLFGVGRWGSSDPWLGIPVTWDMICGARVIVESSFRDLKVTPSEGSHFFQNLASMRIGYFTVDGGEGTGFVDWDWLMGLPPHRVEGLCRHVRLEEPLTVRMDGRTGHGVILRP